jgi:hypothetical protein
MTGGKGGGRANAAEKKEGPAEPHCHNVGLDLWCGTDCKKAPLEAAGSGSGFGRKMTKSFAAWYFSRRDKLAELEGVVFLRSDLRTVS